MRSPIPTVNNATSYARPKRRGRHVSCTLRNLTALCILVPAMAFGDSPADAGSFDDFYITVTADDLYLCGEGFGGIYGCIDEAVSREVESVVISASSDCSVAAVQELINAVHAVGFERVGVASFSEPDTE